jgi:hypothetical protein
LSFGSKLSVSFRTTRARRSPSPRGYHLQILEDQKDVTWEAWVAAVEVAAVKSKHRESLIRV